MQKCERTNTILHTTIKAKSIALLYKGANHPRQTAKGRGCRLARLGPGEAQFVHLESLPQKQDVNNFLLISSREVVLSKVTDTGINAVPYPAGDILNVVGVVR